MAGQIYNKKNWPKRIWAAACLLALVFSLSAPLQVFAQKQKTGQSFIVKLKNSSGINKLESAGSQIEKKFAFSGPRQFENIYTFRSSFNLGELKNILSGEAEYIEPNQTFQTQAVVTNDPGFTSNAQDIDRQWGIIKAGFDQAWQKSTGSTANVVAIIDTGVDASHDDLQNMNVVAGYNFFTNQALQGRVNSDDNGHGTLITGVLAASANNGKGIVGVNWAVSVMPLKALDKSGKGDSSTISEALVWAADHGANIINLSVGGIGFGHDTTLSDSIAYAFKKGAIVVAAAGNDVAQTGGNLDDNPVYPICDDNNANMVIGVTALDQNDLKPEFANYGRNCIDVTAPGKRILSTINFDPLTQVSAPNSYAYASGTSLAVPFVSGTAALLRTLFPNATNVQIRDRIISTADPIDALNLFQCNGQSCRGLLGAGRINAARAAAAGEPAPEILEGDLVKTDSSPTIYQITGGQKRPISSFVFNQRFLGAPVKTLPDVQFQQIPTGPYATPVEGTLVKLDGSPTVFSIANGQKMPISFQVFQQRKLDFSKINTLSFPEVNSWVTGNLLSPLEGTLIRAKKAKTIYWVVGQVLHPVNFAFYIERGLSGFTKMQVSDTDISSFPKGEAYLR